MQAGKLRHRVELRQPAENQDDGGEMIVEYSTYATVWASITPLQGRQLQHAQQIDAETTLRVEIRYNPDVEATNRVIFDDRTLEITAVINPEERNKNLLLACKEIAE